jgi:hypothetical protein
LGVATQAKGGLVTVRTKPSKLKSQTQRTSELGSLGPLAMNSILQRVRDGHWGLVLFVVKVYIIVTPLVGILSCTVANLAGWKDRRFYGVVLQEEEAHRYFILECGYLACLFLLICAGFLQDKRERRSTIACVIWGLFFLACFIYPMTIVLVKKWL